MESKVFVKLQFLAAISKVGTVWKETEPSSNQIVITDFDLQSISTFPSSQTFVTINYEQTELAVNGVTGDLLTVAGQTN